jgi:hypothetical protein
MRFPSRSALLATAATAATLAGVACAHDTSDVINLSKDSFKSVVDPEVRRAWCSAAAASMLTLCCSRSSSSSSSRRGVATARPSRRT